MMTRSTAAASSKTEELEKPNESVNSMEAEEKVDLDGDKDPEETIQEEIEYEEVEEEVEEEVDEEEEIQEVEEVEVEEEEEVDEEEEIQEVEEVKVEEEEEVDEEEEIQEVEELEVEEEEDEDKDDNEIDMKESKEDDKKKHGELLALPPHGSHVILDGIPFTDEALWSLGQSVGEVTEVRTFNGKHSSYGFITFRTEELASKAIQKFHKTKLEGQRIRCSSRVGRVVKNKLYIGNIPKSWGEEDLREVVTEVGPGVITIEHLKDPQNSSHNRGYAFIEYYNHACADYSRLKMSNPNFKLGDNSPTVSWANPKCAESSAAFQGKVIGVQYLPKHVSEDKLKELFGHHGKITEVVLPSAKTWEKKTKTRFGFVHFAENSSAMSAVNPTKDYKIDGKTVRCILKEPKIDGKTVRCILKEPKTDCGVNSQKSPLLPGHPSRVGYGRVGGAYAAVGGEFGALGLTQPLLLPDAAATGVPMMPMLLPDGRIGYVFKRPVIHAHTHVLPPQCRGGSSIGGIPSNEGGQSREQYNLGVCRKKAKIEN